MEAITKLLVVMFSIGTCGACIAFVLTLVDYVHTLRASRPLAEQMSSEQNP